MYFGSKIGRVPGVKTQLRTSKSKAMADFLSPKTLSYPGVSRGVLSLRRPISEYLRHEFKTNRNFYNKNQTLR